MRKGIQNKASKESVRQLYVSLHLHSFNQSCVKVYQPQLNSWFGRFSRSVMEIRAIYGPVLWNKQLYAFGSEAIYNTWFHHILMKVGKLRTQAFNS